MTDLESHPFFGERITHRPGAALVSILVRRRGGRSGHGRGEALVRWAAALTEAGSDEPAVWALAGMGGRAHLPSEIDAQLDAVLDALGLPEPDTDELHDGELRLLCEAVVDGSLAPAAALRCVSWILVDAGYPRRYHDWFELYEDACLLEQGEAPLHGHAPSIASLDQWTRELARRTLDSHDPVWLRRYRALRPNDAR